MRQLGVDAYLFPILRQRLAGRLAAKLSSGHGLHRLKGLGIDDIVAGLKTYRGFDTPKASLDVLADAIVVYPEITPGNPLGAQSVVRWMLHKKGFWKPGIEYSPNELGFFYQEAFLEPDDGIDRSNELRIRWIRDDIYFNRNLRGRTGTCRLIRKGTAAGVDAPPENDDAILLDGLSHRDKAAVFNQTDVMISHDAYTMYNYYAAACGCTPVVLPQPGLTREDWRSKNELKHGVAWGMEELDWARATRQQLLDEMQVEFVKEWDQVRSFVRKVKAHFDC